MHPIRCALEPARQPDVIALIEALDAYQKPLYPPESHYGIDIDALSQPQVIFAVARVGARAVGCGAVVLDGPFGEIKRMFVDPAVRGSGAARGLLDLLEAQARPRGCSTLRLETGIHQHDAIRFYERAGFKRCERFADYPDDPLSIFMAKVLKGAGVSAP